MGLTSTLAALTLEALAMSMVFASLIAGLAIAGGAWRLQETMLGHRQVEALIDRACTRAGMGLAGGEAVAEASPTLLSLHSDLDGNGYVDSHSAEVTSLELRAEKGGARLLHRMGRQSMTLLKQLPAESRFSYLSPAGGPAGGAQKISVVVVDLGDRVSVHAIAPARWD